ncbi:hypothetical protein ACJQWK_04506 [Exserohilum turcicum]
MPPNGRDLLLCFDAFGTLFAPSIPIPIAYARAAAHHGIRIGNTQDVGTSFKLAFKQESQRNPNYGKSSGLGSEKWWANIIHATFTPFLRKDQPFPHALTTELLDIYSSSRGYTLFPDVTPFFSTLRALKQQRIRETDDWPWHNTVVGIVTNSDDRVPGILESLGLSIGPRRVGTKDNRDKEASSHDDISFVVLSYDVGVEKPHSGMFRAAEDMLGEMVDAGLEEFEKLYVGDEVEKDYFGARDAGWGALLLSRTPEAPSNQGITRVHVKGKDGETSIVDTISSLSDIASWRPSRPRPPTALSPL